MRLKQIIEPLDLLEPQRAFPSSFTELLVRATFRVNTCTQSTLMIFLYYIRVHDKHVDDISLNTYVYTLTLAAMCIVFTSKLGQYRVLHDIFDTLQYVQLKLICIVGV